MMVTIIVIIIITTTTTTSTTTAVTIMMVVVVVVVTTTTITTMMTVVIMMMMIMMIMIIMMMIIIMMMMIKMMMMIIMMMMMIMMMMIAIMMMMMMLVTIIAIIMTLTDTIQDFLQSPHCTINCLMWPRHNNTNHIQHIRSLPNATCAQERSGTTVKYLVSAHSPPPHPPKHKFLRKVGGGRLLCILPFVQSIIQPLKVQVNTKRLEFKQKSYLFQF